MRRLKYDQYSTPSGLALAITNHLAQHLPAPPALVVEPSAGVGPFIEAARTTWPQAEIHAVDYDHHLEHKCRTAGADAFYAMPWEDYAQKFKPDEFPVLVLGNPPYTNAQEHIEAALAFIGENEGHLAFLLRLNFLAGLRRARTLYAESRLCYIAPVAPRPSFAFKGTDPTEYMLTVWRNGSAGALLLPPLIWNKGR